MLKSRNEEELSSKVIAFLRFPLIIGVLFIHNADPKVSILGKCYGCQTRLIGYEACTDLLSKVLCAVSVPIFFVISGYLFFLSVDNFTIPVYLKKLKSRMNSLLVPYLFWNGFLMIFLYSMTLIPVLSNLVSNKEKWGISYIIRSFWGQSAQAPAPICVQFWFIRDLMVVVLTTPIIYFFVKNLKWAGILILGLLYCFGWNGGIPGLGVDSIFYFVFGASFSINKINLVTDIKKTRIISFIIYPIFILVDFLNNYYEGNNCIHKLGILAGIFFWFNIISLLLSTNKVRLNKFLTQSSFFLFAFHNYLMIIIKKITYLIIKPESEILLTFLYFLIIFATVVICLGVYFLLHRLLPKFCQVITGGR